MLTEIKRYTVIDGWKGFLTIFIVMFHFEAFQGYKYFSTGFLGVEFFFLITGFFVGYTVYKKGEENILPFQETVNKAKRIYPIYLYQIVVMIVGYILLPEVRYYYTVNPVDALMELLMLQISIQPYNIINSPTWYISAMMICSFIVFTLIHVFKNNFYILFAPIIILICYSIENTFGIIGATGERFGIIVGGLIRGMGAICLGILVFRMSRIIEKNKPNNKVINFIEVVFTIILLFFFFNQKNTLVILVPMSILLLCAALECGMISQILKSRIFQFLGKFSLSIYITHIFIIDIIRGYLPQLSNNRFFSTVVCWILVIGTAIFSQWFVSTALTKDNIIRTWTRIKEGCKKGKGLYIFGISITTILFMINGIDLWGEIVAEYMRYAQGESITGSFAGYLTIFPIIVGYVYHYIFNGNLLSWFQFSAIVSYLYTVLCIVSIIRVLKTKMRVEYIVIILISFFALLAHPSVSSLINITHLGYVPIMLHIIVCIFGDEFIEEVGKLPKITYLPLCISIISKPSFTFIPFILVILFTKSYKHISSLVLLIISSAVSIYQIVLFSNGNVGLKITTLKDFIKFIFVSVQATGSSILFGVKYYIEGDVSRIIIGLSLFIGAFIISIVIFRWWKDKSYAKLVGGIILGAIIVACQIPYITMDYGMPITVLINESAKLCFWKHKLQYQLTSTVVMVTILLCTIDYLFKVYKPNVEIRQGVVFIFVILSLNGMFSGIYSGQWQTVKEIKGSYVEYDNNQSFIYPPLPDWDWSWTNGNLNGWVKGNTYTKYLYKPNSRGEKFEEKNPSSLPENISNAKIFLMYSEMDDKERKGTNYWDFFEYNNKHKNIFIDDTMIKLTETTSNGIRYGVMEYTSEIAKKLYEDGCVIKNEKGESIEGNKLNFIIVWH